MSILLLISSKVVRKQPPAVKKVRGAQRLAIPNLVHTVEQGVELTGNAGLEGSLVSIGGLRVGAGASIGGLSCRLEGEGAVVGRVAFAEEKVTQERRMGQYLEDRFREVRFCKYFLDVS